MSSRIMIAIVFRALTDIGRDSRASQGAQRSLRDESRRPLLRIQIPIRTERELEI